MLLLFILPFWLFFQGILAMGGFYEDSSGVPPRLVLFAIVPALLLIAVYLIFFRHPFIEKLPLRSLTILHIVRIPVEIVLLWLFLGGQVPHMMTFEGRNFDIVAGIAAPIVYWVSFRKGETHRGILIAFNILGLMLLANIVTIAVISLPSAVQLINFDEPNRAVLYFPYVWLPSIVVPIVLFSHLASLVKLSGKHLR
ncbi:MAG: hypothetical protein ABJA02_12705 [Acidobacteriota bacterium]